MNFRCFFPSWIAAWVTAVFLPSVLIAYLGISPPAAAIGTGFRRLPASAWKVADDVGPAVKLMIGGLLLVGLLVLNRTRILEQGARYASSMMIGVIAVTATIALIPASLSRGFAALLTGTRFDPLVTSIYLVGGALAGLAFVVSSDRCRRSVAKQGSGPARR